MIKRHDYGATVKDEEEFDAEEFCLCVIDKDIDEVTGAIAKEYGAKQVDEKIDDGTDKDGVYVMLRSFSVKGWHIRLYYTSDDGIITDADYMKD